jgi:hypothetical protein
MDSVKRIAEVMCLQYIQSPQQHRNIAVLVLDREDDSLRIRFTADWTDCDNTTLDIVANLAADLHFRAQHLGASDFVAHLRQTLSHRLCISDEQPIVSEDLEAELNRLEEILITRYPTSVGTGGTRVFTHADYRAAGKEHNRATAAPPLVLTPARQLSIADIGYATAAAIVVTATLFGSATVLSRNKPGSVTQHSKAPLTFEITRVTSIDLPLRQSPLEMYLAMLPDTVTKQPFSRARRHAVKAKPTRQFVPPDDDSSELPEMALYVTSPTAHSLKSEAIVIGSSGIAVPPPPAVRSTGLRRVFQAIARVMF